MATLQIQHTALPEGAKLLQQHPKADAQAVRLRNGREVLRVDGKVVHLAKGCVKPHQVVGMLQQMQGRDLKKGLDHLRRLGAGERPLTLKADTLWCPLCQSKLLFENIAGVRVARAGRFSARCATCAEHFHVKASRT